MLTGQVCPHAPRPGGTRRWRTPAAVVVAKAGLAALAQAQAAFSDAAADFGVGDDTEVQALVDDVRGRVS
jgi:hypothetical protein